MNYPDSVEFLYALGNEIKTAKLGLERIAAVLEALGRPQDRCRFVHVAGTNGKGSTSAMIDSGLGAAGWRTGLFTSPHLSQPTERIRIDGVPLSRAGFAAAFDRVHGVVEELLRRGAIDFHTTYFETVTAMALETFARSAEIAVLEVGLGGRLDATNVVEPELCAITPIDFDHEVYLGRSLEAIAGEKAGILKPGTPAVFARQRPEAERVLEARAAALGIPGTRTADWKMEDLELDARGSRFRLSQVGQAVSPANAAKRHSLDIRCPLAGEHQVENAIAAAAALFALGIPGAAIEGGIGAARWPGRLERVSEQPEIILDGAHNPAGARALAAYIDRFYSGRRVRLIYGAMRDKAVEEIGGILFPRAGQVIAPRRGRRGRWRRRPSCAPAITLRCAPLPISGGARPGGGCAARRRHLRRRLPVPGGGSAGYPGGRAMSFLRSLFLSTPLIALSTIVMGTLSMVASLFDGTGNSQHHLARLWGRSLLAFGFIRLEIEGLEKLDRGATYVFVSNHASYMDIPAILTALPFQFRFFAKSGLYKIPFLGTHLKRAGHLPVDRSNARNSLKSMTEARTDHRRPRHFGAVVSGRRTLAQRPARFQGRRGLYRHQGRRACGADGAGGHAREAAHGLHPHSRRPRPPAHRRSHPHRRVEGLGPGGVDTAAARRSVAPARRPLSGAVRRRAQLIFTSMGISAPVS